MKNLEKPAAFLAMVALLAGSIPGSAQTEVTALESLPAIYSEVLDVRVVNLEVVVTDKTGIPVRGLRPENFLLEIGGEEVAIDYFSEVRGGIAMAMEPGDDGVEILGPPAIAPGEPVGTSYLLFIDDYFSIRRDRNTVLDAMIPDLPRLGPEDRMAVVAFNGKDLDMLSTWSQSVPALERVLKKAKDRPTFGLHRLAEQRQFNSDALARLSARFEDGRLTTQDFYRNELTPNERFYVQRLTDQVQDSVVAAASTLRSFAMPPGRKVMILLSGGWPFLPANFLAAERPPLLIPWDIDQGEPLFRLLSDTANLLGYTIYPVDVPGFTDVISDASVSRDASTFGINPNSLTFGREGFLRQQEVEFSLRFLAKQTGGRAFINGQRLEVFDSVASDTRSYYWLGFSPDREWDDKRHDVNVSLRIPGFRIRSRENYLDSSRQREVTMAVESTLLFGSPPGRSPLSVELGKSAKARKRKMNVPMTVRFPLERITFVPSGGSQVAQLELRIAVKDENGKRADIPVIPVALQLAGEPAEGAMASYDLTLKLRRLKHHAVVAIHDPLSGTILSTSLEINP